jgi:hypothetical protein
MKQDSSQLWFTTDLKSLYARSTFAPELLQGWEKEREKEGSYEGFEEKRAFEHDGDEIGRTLQRRRAC